jgi:hypothetical protein
MLIFYGSKFIEWQDMNELRTEMLRTDMATMLAPGGTDEESAKRIAYAFLSSYSAGIFRNRLSKGGVSLSFYLLIYATRKGKVSEPVVRIYPLLRLTNPDVGNRLVVDYSPQKSTRLPEAMSQNSPHAFRRAGWYTLASTRLRQESSTKPAFLVS